MIWVQDLNSYIIFCTFNKTSFVPDEGEPKPEIWNTTLALYYNIEAREIIYYASQHLGEIEVRKEGAFYDEFSKVIYLVDNTNQTTINLYYFLGCPIER